ncbi:DUF885 domain-containing protein [Micrococcoides hystricis]|uniref:DUF885 domain-containing protein n=1 Tax=Micrococcoides hystricis TaxID=1572761 RepID=A0ABV6PAC1_9MICC
MTHTEAPARPTSAVDALANDLMAQLHALDPATAYINGYRTYPNRYADYSPAGTRAERELLEDTLEKLAQLPDADEIDAVTRAAMQERMGLQIEMIDSQVTLLNNIATPAHGIRTLFDLIPTQTAEDWEVAADFLADVPHALSGYQDSLLHSAKHALAPARRQVDTVAGQMRAHASADGFFHTFIAAAPADLDEDLKNRLADGAAAATEAYGNFVTFLTEELDPLARDEDGVGKEYYQLASRYFLGATVDLEETYRWGIQELDRLVAAEEELARNILPEGSEVSVAALRKHFTNDPARKIVGTDALQAWMQEKADTAVAELGKEHFEIPEPVRTIECMIAPTQEGGIYYTPPSDDFSRPGRMWWSVPPATTEFATWIETTTVYHEGVPGHHLQLGLATYYKDLLNDWRRHGCWISGHGEGWALYSEELMHELGYLDDPADYLGMLDAQRFRAARVVFDIGLHLGLRQPEHYGGQIWNAENGREFLDQHFNMSEGEREFEWLRYMGWPGQAPSYKVGQRVWEDIRAEQEELLGADFDLKDFHSRALKLGSVGLDVLREALKAQA